MASSRPQPGASSPSESDPRSDHELLRALAAEDRQAFGALVTRWRPRVVNFCLRRGADLGGAEDCAQETFVRIYGYRHAYRPQAPFASFLFTVARNALLDWGRRRGRRRERSEFSSEASPDADGEGSRLGLAGFPAREERDPDARLDLVAALAELPPHLRTVAELAGVRGLPYQAVAVLLGIPEGTVKSRMHHLVERLRRTLAP